MNKKTSAKSEKSPSQNGLSKNGVIAGLTKADAARTTASKKSIPRRLKFLGAMVFFVTFVLIFNSALVLREHGHDHVTHLNSSKSRFLQKDRLIPTQVAAVPNQSDVLLLLPNKTTKTNRTPVTKVLTAFLEPSNTLQYDVHPLPPRNTSASILTKQEFPQLKTCSRLLQDFSNHVVDHYPEEDAFLPWIHDFFPTSDGTMIRFVAENKRNCDTGQFNVHAMKFWESQISLYQPESVRVEQQDDTLNQQLVRLSTASSNPQKDPNLVIETRFLCHFHDADNNTAVTFSVFPFNYEFVSFRKRSVMLKAGGLGRSPIWISQLMFYCPVPKHFQSTIRNQLHIVNDTAQLWVDVIPIRTPPRGDTVRVTYEHIGNTIKTMKRKIFDAEQVYGKHHYLPAIQDSGRWANLPICFPPPNAAEKTITTTTTTTTTTKTNKHHLVACTWTSASYNRRGDVVTVEDNDKRLREWILYQKMVGFDQVYIYDNTPINITESPLQAIVDEFPGFAVHHRWPCKICNNNRPAHKSPGYRSSQYAAEASCRERYGPTSDWMTFIDTDEYLIPMNGTTWTGLLRGMEKRGIHLLKLRSSRNLPRIQLMEPRPPEENCEPPPTSYVLLRQNFEPEPCLGPRQNETYLKVFNCDSIKRPRPDRFDRAMKQIFRPDYVLNHFVHYSTVTVDIATYHRDLKKNEKFHSDYRQQGLHRELYLDELTQGTLSHARSVMPFDTVYRSQTCFFNSSQTCEVGFECPDYVDYIDDKPKKNFHVDEEGNYCNCWINHHVDNVLAPKLESVLEEHRINLLEKQR